MVVLLVGSAARPLVTEKDHPLYFINQTYAEGNHVYQSHVPVTGFSGYGVTWQSETLSSCVASEEPMALTRLVSKPADASEALASSRAVLR